jgi:hypothetical protein
VFALTGNSTGLPSVAVTLSTQGSHAKAKAVVLGETVTPRNGGCQQVGC